jgi:hypothetical protein
VELRLCDYLGIAKISRPSLCPRKRFAYLRPESPLGIRAAVIRPSCGTNTAHAGNRRRQQCGHGRCTAWILEQAASLSLAMGLTTILTTIWVCPPKYAQVQNPYFKENWTSADVLWTRCRCLGSKSHELKPRQPDPAGAVHAGPGSHQPREERDAMIELIGATCSNFMKKIRNSAISVRSGPCVWARFRRDSAGDSLEVVHDQRPPTPFHAQNRQFQPLTTTANDTWGV